MSINGERIREYDETVEKFEKMDRIRRIKQITITGIFACLLAAIVVYAVNIGHKLDKLNDVNTIVVVKNETTTVSEDTTYDEGYTDSESVSEIQVSESEYIDETVFAEPSVIETTSDKNNSEVTTTDSKPDVLITESEVTDAEQSNLDSDVHTTESNVTDTEQSNSGSDVLSTESIDTDTEQSADDSDGQVYYVTKTGKKYHRAGCSYLKTKIEITIDKINSGGYEPCSRCIG